MASNNYSKQKQAQEVVWAALIDVQRQLDYCERMIDAERGEHTIAYKPGPLTVDAQGDVVKNADYWATVRQSVLNNRNNWTNAYILMFYDGNQDYKTTIFNDLRRQASKDPIAIPAADAVS